MDFYALAASLEHLVERVKNSYLTEIESIRHRDQTLNRVKLELEQKAAVKQFNRVELELNQMLEDVRLSISLAENDINHLMNNCFAKAWQEYKNSREEFCSSQSGKVRKAVEGLCQKLRSNNALLYGKVLRIGNR